jgi:hypothetical protein
MQAISTVSHISFGEDGSVPPKKPTSVAEVAKQRELSGTLQSVEGSKTKQISNAKSKELSGHDIFADPQDSRHNRARNSSNGSPASHTPVKNANVQQHLLHSIGFLQFEMLFLTNTAALLNR